MGKVTVHVLEAQSLHDSQTFGKQDPYVLVEVRAPIALHRCRLARPVNARSRHHNHLTGMRDSFPVSASALQA